MFHRRNSTSINTDSPPPYPPRGAFGGRRRTTLVTNQATSNATATQVVETGSPESETPPQVTQVAPPMPPRSPSPPQLPPRRSGLRRGSTQPNAQETFSPAPDFPSQSKLPKSMPMPALLSPPGSMPPPTPTRPQLSVLDENVGGFAMPSPSQHGSNHRYSNQLAAECHCPCLSSAGPSRPQSDLPDEDELADISGGVHAKVWPTYNKISQEFDEKKLNKWNEDLDVLLIFAALFSAIVTSFLINALGDLGPDYQQQSALLLYQILNGRDPSLASISDPTAPFEPSGFAIAVNCLWFASLSASLGASFGAMICKEWLTEYNGGANPVINLLRACQRQIRFMAFQRWNVHTLISLLPPLLHSSVLLFFTGATIYLWQIDIRVAIVYLTIGGIFGITYFISTLLPFVMNAPFRPYSTLLVHQLSVAIGEIIMPIVDSIAHVCFLALRYMIGAFLWPFAQTIFNEGTLGAWYLRARTILPSEYKPMGVWWANAFNESLDEIDTDERVQEEAILWLSQMPLNLTQFKDMIPSLALISSSRPHKFQKSVVVFLNLTLESLSPETTGQAWPELAIDCLLVLERIKYQSVVDQDWDEDHNVGGISVSAVVARAAQKVVADASDKDSPHSEETRARLLAAAAWLSPVDATEEVTSDGKKLKIQDRWGFVEKLRAKLAQYIRGDGSLVDNKALISLVHGMHACIPRDDYGSTSSIVSFLLLVCDDYDSPWSKDESVLRALITYALDLLLPPSMRRPLVGREIGFDQLASELIDALRADATSPDVVAFGFWLVYRVPYAFRSRKWMLADIVYIWTLANANETIQQVLRQRVNFHAVDAFVAVAQHHHASPNRTLPKLAYNTLDLLKTALEDSYAQPMATYAVAMILGLGPSSQVTSFTRGVSAESFTKVLHTVRSDLKKNTTEEEIIDLHIYSTLVLLKLRPPQEDAETAKALIEEDVEMVKALIEEMEKTIEDPVLGDSKAEVSADLDRVRWKAIYLCGLLFKLLPPGEWEEPIERVRERVRTLLRSGELSVAGDYERCVEPLDVGGLELAVQGRPTYTAFKAWIKGFPCFFLDGSVSGASI